MEEIVFQVGSTHQNEKGPYEVLSMDDHKDTMVIKWENGEEATTAISFQRRILERVRSEIEAAKAGNGTKRGKGGSASSAKFDGFKDTDFSGGVSGTTWRTQKGLGGVITNLLNSDILQIKSLAVPRVPEAHWRDTGRPERDAKGFEAKLFVKLDKENLYYGFSVERPKDTSGNQEDWKGFVEWISDDQNETWFREIVDEYDLHIYGGKDKANPFDGQIRFNDGAWRLGNAPEEQQIASLSGFLKELPDTTRVDLRIAKITGKEDAIGRGGEMAEEISNLFDALMPVYRAAMLQPKP